MLLQNRPTDCETQSQRWLAGAGAGLLALAVILAGLHVVPRAGAEPVKDEKKPAPDKPKKDDKAIKPAPVVPVRCCGIGQRACHGSAAESSEQATRA